MSGKLGLVELLVVFLAVFGWGFYELRSLSRDRKQREQRHRDESQKRPPP